MKVKATVVSVNVTAGERLNGGKVLKVKAAYTSIAQFKVL